MPRRSARREYIPPPSLSKEELRAKTVENAKDLLAHPEHAYLHPDCLFGAYRSRDQAREKLVKWQGGFAENPAYALEWSVGAFETAAELRVLESVIDLHERGRGAPRDPRSTRG